MNEYAQAITQAEINLKDVKLRGNDALGGTWEDLRNELFTKEENAASDLRVEMMLKSARTKRERRVSRYIGDLPVANA